MKNHHRMLVMTVCYWKVNFFKTSGTVRALIRKRNTFHSIFFIPGVLDRRYALYILFLISQVGISIFILVLFSLSNWKSQNLRFSSNVETHFKYLQHSLLKYQTLAKNYLVSLFFFKLRYNLPITYVSFRCLSFWLCCWIWCANTMLKILASMLIGTLACSFLFQWHPCLFVCVRVILTS